MTKFKEKDIVIDGRGIMLKILAVRNNLEDYKIEVIRDYYEEDKIAVHKGFLGALGFSNDSYHLYNAYKKYKKLRGIYGRNG